MRSGSLTSGLETIVWRHRWEASKDPAAKQTLLDYNRQDCEALELVANRVVDLHRAAPAKRKVVAERIGSYIRGQNSLRPAKPKLLSKFCGNERYGFLLLRLAGAKVN
jgi:hypothetical protein